MAESAAFTLVCTHLESATGLARPAARGTVRLALKEAGLDAAGVTPDQMKVVLDKVLPAELAARGIEEPESHCAALAAGIEGLAAAPAGESPDAVFARLGGTA